MGEGDRGYGKVGVEREPKYVYEPRSATDDGGSVMEGCKLGSVLG